MILMGNETCNTVWINPSDGVVRKDSDGSYNNRRFVKMIHEDKTALGYMMSMRYPTETTTRLKGDIPDFWSPWDIPDLATSDIIQQCCDKIDGLKSIGEIDGSERLWIPRKEQSKRMRHIALYSGFSVTTHGIISKGAPDTLIDCISQVVAGVYAIVEKNTVASIRDKNKTSVSPARMKKMNACFDIVSRRDRVAEVGIISSYAEPSSTTVLRLFYLYDILGRDTTHEICDSIYYDMFEEQLYSIEESMHIALQG